MDEIFKNPILYKSIPIDFSNEIDNLENKIICFQRNCNYIASINDTDLLKHYSIEHIRVYSKIISSNQNINNNPIKLVKDSIGNY
jgi:hypothetical protein